MTRTHWLLLLTGFAIILAATLVEERAPEPEPNLPPELASEPELYMRGATITQYDDDGSLRYRLRARQLFHFPDQDRSLLEAPELRFVRNGPVPWDVGAERGRVVYLDDAGTEREIVHLEKHVVLQRVRPSSKRFLRLETETLTVHPDSQLAVTDQPVMITTEVGSTRAHGLEAHLADGKLFLGTQPDTRVSTRIDKPKLLADDVLP